MQTYSHIDPLTDLKHMLIISALETVIEKQMFSVSPYFLKAVQGALHVFITPEHVRERALSGGQVCQGGVLLHRHGMQSPLGTELTVMLIL